MFTNYHIYMIIALRGRKMSLNLHEGRGEVEVQSIACAAALRTVLCVRVSVCMDGRINK